MQMWQIVANLEFVTGFATDLQTRKPNISPRVKHGKMQRSRPDENVVVTVISQRFVVSEYKER